MIWYTAGPIFGFEDPQVFPAFPACKVWVNIRQNSRSHLPCAVFLFFLSSFFSTFLLFTFPICGCFSCFLLLPSSWQQKHSKYHSFLFLFRLLPYHQLTSGNKIREQQPTEGHATFSASHHSKAFNVVHVIAGVVGVVGAAMIAVVAFVVCRRHRRRRRESSYSNNNDTHRISSSTKASSPSNMKSSQPGLSSSCAPINASSSSKPSSLPFDQFASAFSYDEQQQQRQQSSSLVLTSPSVSRVAISDHHLRRHPEDDIEAGPSMQQLQLQYRLMQSSSPPQTTTSSADHHTSQSPPPPYQP